MLELSILLKAFCCFHLFRALMYSIKYRIIYKCGICHILILNNFSYSSNF